MVEIACAICGRLREESSLYRVELTPEEKSACAPISSDVPDVLHYCKPCWKNMSDPVTCVSFMHSLLEIQLNAAGVVDSGKLATKYQGWLLSHTKNPRS